MTNTELNENEYHEYFGRYIYTLSEEITLKEGFQIGEERVLQFFESISEEKMDHTYEEGKWSIKEVLQHIIDVERMFAYRMFRLGRLDNTQLAGFDQNEFMETADVQGKTKAGLLDEYKATRAQSISILKGISDNNLAHIGNSSGHNLSARAAGFIILGHEQWHCNLIKEKYLD